MSKLLKEENFNKIEPATGLFSTQERQRQAKNGPIGKKSKKKEEIIIVLSPWVEYISIRKYTKTTRTNLKDVIKNKI